MFENCIVTGRQEELKLTEHEGQKFLQRGLSNYDVSLAWMMAELDCPGRSQIEPADPKDPKSLLVNKDPLMNEQFTRYRVLFSLGGSVIVQPGTKIDRKLGQEGWTLQKPVDLGDEGPMESLPITIENVQNLGTKLYLKLLDAVNALSDLSKAEERN